jgi:hypothetical protein
VVSEELTDFLLALRYTFLGLGLLGLGLYIWRLQRVRVDQYSFEQVQTLRLGAALVCFNDPFFALYVFLPNVASNVFSVLFLTLFFVSLFLYWASILEYIYRDMTDSGNRLCRAVVAALLFVGVFGLYLSFQLATLSDPFFDGVLHTPLIKGFIIYTALAVGLVLIYLGIFIYRSWAKGLIWRNKVFVALVVVYAPLTTVALCTLGLSFYSYGQYSVVVVINYNLLVWAYMYLYTNTDEAIVNNPQPEPTQHYIDFEQNLDIEI